MYNRSRKPGTHGGLLTGWLAGVPTRERSKTVARPMPESADRRTPSGRRWAGPAARGSASRLSCLVLLVAVAGYVAELPLLLPLSTATDACSCSAGCACRVGDDRHCSCDSGGLSLSALCGCGGGDASIDLVPPLAAELARPPGIVRAEGSKPLAAAPGARPGRAGPRAPEPPP